MEEMSGRFRVGRHRAISLIEVLIATVVLATAVVAVAAALVAGTQQTYQAVDSRRGTELAPGDDGGNTRVALRRPGGGHHDGA